MSKQSKPHNLQAAWKARKVPIGVVNDRVYLRIPEVTRETLQKQTATERGDTYCLGLEIQADGYLLLYDLIEALGGRIIATIIGPQITIVTRKKSYEGDNQSQLLLEIIRDLLQSLGDKNENYDV